MQRAASTTGRKVAKDCFAGPVFQIGPRRARLVRAVNASSLFLPKQVLLQENNLKKLSSGASGARLSTTTLKHLLMHRSANKIKWPVY